MKFNYTKVADSYHIGDTIRNLNGSSYFIIDKLTDKNLLLMKQDNQSLVLAIGTDTYDRINRETNTVQRGIEWGYGIYLNGTISNLNFEELKKQYGESKENEEKIEGNGIYSVEVKETLSRIVDVKADSWEDAFNQVQDKYNREEIVLDAEDFDGIEMQQYEEKEREKVR